MVWEPAHTAPTREDEKMPVRVTYKNHAVMGGREHVKGWMRGNGRDIVIDRVIGGRVHTIALDHANVQRVEIMYVERTPEATR